MSSPLQGKHGCVEERSVARRWKGGEVVGSSGRYGRSGFDEDEVVVEKEEGEAAVDEYGRLCWLSWDWK